MITIYGRQNSSSVQLVMSAINELGLAHQRLDYGHGHASTRTVDYLAMNPMGRIPVMVDSSVQMFESAAILRYLGQSTQTQYFGRKTMMNGVRSMLGQSGARTLLPQPF
jgi:glutathione S-transferase